MLSRTTYVYKVPVECKCKKKFYIESEYNDHMKTCSGSFKLVLNFPNTDLVDYMKKYDILHNSK